MSIIREKYKTEVVEAMVKSRGYKNRMQVPRVEKVVVNLGVNSNWPKEALEEAMQEVSAITGQRPVVTKSKKSISNFKLRKGQPCGVCVTLRGQRMYEFLDRFVMAALPRIRDFRGVSSRGFDGTGNYTFGVKEQVIFPEIELDKVKRTMGMNVTVATTARTDAEAKELLKLLGVPFAEK
jgi:large subunit ribosomal protein L5